MSIQSEITRISGNVADALTAIGNKGVTVPQGANSDDLADLIGSIQTGGTDFIVSISEVNGVWTPDKTFAEIQTAYNSGKTIVASNPDGVWTYGVYDDGAFYYGVILFGNDEHGVSYYTAIDYHLDGTGIHLDGNSGNLIHPTGTKQISITANGTVTENVSAYANAEITVNVSGGTPSQTQHTIYFEFTDETNTAITGYWNDSFISNAITATEPETYGQKTVTLAQLDGVTWYSYDPTESWETLYENNATQYNPEGDTTIPPFCWITSLSDVYPTVGSVWRITFDSVTYRCTAVADGSTIIIGNPLYGPNYNDDDGSGVPFAFYNVGWGAWTGAADLQPYSVNHNVPVKIERLVTS